MPRVVACVGLVAGVLLAGCTSDEPRADGGSAQRTAPAGGPSVMKDGRVEVASLQLRLRLPESFAPAEDPELLFLARSADPPAILSISGDSAAVVGHEAADGETLSPASIEGVKGVVVTNAQLEGLPPGIVANELLVSNGDRSFSLILSSSEKDLPLLWDDLLSSISID